MDYHKLLELQRKVNGIACLTFHPSADVIEFFKNNNIEYVILPQASKISSGDQMIYIIPKKDKPIKVVFTNKKDDDMEINYPGFIVTKGEIK